MPKLNSEQLRLITKAGDLMQRLIENGNLEEGTDERHCFNSLSLFFRTRDITEWRSELTFEEWHVVTQQALPRLEQILTFSKLFSIRPAN